MRSPPPDVDETAQSTVRNLNNADCDGRSLRIDLADSDIFLGATTMRGELTENQGGWRDRHRDGSSDRDRDYCAGGYRSGSHGSGGGRDEWLNALPRGSPLPPGMSAMDAISQTVASIRPAQMMEILASMKRFIMDYPDRAHALLTANPQLAYALFQALLVTGIVDPSILHRMIEESPMQNAPHPAPVRHALPPSHQNPPPMPHIQPNFPPQYPPQHMSPPSAMYPSPPPGHMGYPPLPPPAAQSNYYQSPMPPPQSANTRSGPGGPAPGPGGPPGVVDAANAIPDAQRAMLIQMLQMSDEQVNLLPPNERQAIQQLRSQVMALGSSLGGS